MHEDRVTVNGKRIIVRSRSEEYFSTKAIIISHARFQPHTYLTGEANIPVPPGVKVYHYIHHNERLQSHMMRDQYEAMQYALPGRRGWIKEYTDERLIKNYTLRPDQDTLEWQVPSVGRFDLIIPAEIMRTRDILQAVEDEILPYEELHFLTCRGIALTASLPI
ncbi:putative adhesin [Burkholderia ubonensis]|uniref:putative adhesin n=1 Tax=Burkholderia ubonensis TaxID=101571 RepID=UPI0012F8FF55|nr:hypothetical protein [Burkholderia ubonensis]